MPNNTLKTTIELLNPWWNKKEIETGLPRPKYQKKIEQSLNDKRITFLLGSRRVGKTYLIFQTINNLIKQKINPQRILFLSLDNINLKDLNILNYLGENKFDYLFFDEIQYLGNWQKTLKSFYDLPKKKSIKIICSGSSSALINNSRNVLTGRNTEIIIYPLDYTEFCFFANSKNRDITVESYLEHGGYPEYVLERKPFYHQELLRDVIEKDIVSQFKIKLTTPVFEIINLIAKQIGYKTSLNKLSRILGISDDTVKSYLEYLSQVYLLSSVYKYSPSINDRIYSAKKYYFWDSGIRNNQIGFEDIGSLAENAIFIKLKQLYPQNEIFYYSDFSHSEIDFVSFNNKKEAILIEVKYEKYLEKIEKKLSKCFFKDIRGLEIKRRIVISNGVNDNLKIKDANINIIDLKTFLNYMENHTI